jgi:nucleoside-diphosphate-sugar epimerase
MSDRHVVVGAGPVGRATAALLAARGSEVVLASRSGAGPEIPGTRRVAVDAASAQALADLAGGAVAVYNCVNPSAYHQWAALWPPVAAALLEAARRSGATLVTAGNLYPYGPVDTEMVEGMPDAGTGEKARIRARMWADALGGHQRGELRAVEVRGSDYMGPGIGANGHVPRVVPRALQGKGVQVFGDPDQPHTWTDVLDMARSLVAVPVARTRGAASGTRRRTPRAVSGRRSTTCARPWAAPPYASAPCHATCCGSSAWWCRPWVPCRRTGTSSSART